MNALALHPVARTSTNATSRNREALHIDASMASADLFLSGDDGPLTLGLPEVAEAVEPLRATCVATLRALGTGDELTWYLVSRTSDLHVNGKQPLSLLALEPGDIVAIGGGLWMAARYWQCQPMPAPAEVANVTCPVCGDPLGLPGINVVQCPCGRWTHLQDLHDRANKMLQNCYFESDPCPDCKRPAQLEPQLIPEIPEKLLDDVSES